MSQTVASAFGNRIVTFVDIDNEYNCVICMQVADEPVRCSGLCAGILCNGCMQQALACNRSCPSRNQTYRLHINIYILQTLFYLIYYIISIMSQTVASALNNRVDSFVNSVDDDFNCAICHQVTDELVRCSGMCSGAFCSICMTTHLNKIERSRRCVDKKSDIEA